MIGAAVDIQKLTENVKALMDGLEVHRYICSDQIATAVYLAYHLHKPVLIEGPPGVGKTELAKTTAEMFALPLIRLQCYEGLDEAKAIYEWKYGKQLLYTQVLKETLDEVLQGAKGFAESVHRLHEFGDIFFSEEFLEPRPLLKALREEDGCVLLIDEVGQVRPRIRILVAGNALRFSGIHSGNRHRQSRAPTTHGISHQQQYPGDFRRAQASLSASVHSISGRGTRTAHHPRPRAGDSPGTAQAAGRVHSRAQGAGPEKGAGNQRDHRLGTHPAIVYTRRALDPQLVRDTLNVILKFQEDIENVDAEITTLTSKVVK